MNKRRKQSIWLRRNLPLLIAAAALVLLFCVLGFDLLFEPGPLRELSGLISGLVKPHGRMAISGILESQAPELLEVYSQWFEMNPATEREEWCRLDGIKKG